VVPARTVGKLTESQRSEAVQRYADGATLAQVAAMYGVTSRLSDTELAASRDFWRGVVDGDGSMGVYVRPKSTTPLPQFRLVGQRRRLDAFADFLVANGISGLSVRPHKSIYSIGTTCRPAQRIAALLNGGAAVALRRKAAMAARVSGVEARA
jgi:hypothetical protein